MEQRDRESWERIKKKNSNIWREGLQMIEKCWEKERGAEECWGRKEGPLSVIQTEQTDSILEDSRLRAESSQGRQKAYSSLESSLDNTHTHKQRDTHTETWIEDAQALLPRYNPHLHTEPNTHTSTALLTLGLNLATKKKIISVDSFNTKRAERQKSLIHVRLNTETMTSQTIC